MARHISPQVAAQNAAVATWELDRALATHGPDHTRTTQAATAVTTAVQDARDSGATDQQLADAIRGK